ncbi:unnamed protein product [Musa acuminata subsp. malaccensis]|uniref:(wild Malaysian banana) hypothetical protein n=1 Tax=Musa acuminata subsp. malaccensis TaxID=214687 RepID=A0A804K4C8_MUSAM|nr:unnamed protein product [Musa acuminata subsp. malaccensis]
MNLGQVFLYAMMHLQKVSLVGVLSFLHSLLSYGTFWRRLVNVLCFSVSCQGY